MKAFAFGIAAVGVGLYLASAFLLADVAFCRGWPENAPALCSWGIHWSH